MKKVVFLSILSVSILIDLSAQGKVGINTTAPAAMLHVKDSSVVFTGPASLPAPGNPPATGGGTRLMWYPHKAAFRTGHVSADSWNKDSIGLYSIATGINTAAFGYASTAFGQHTKAIGSYTFAVGQNSKATGQYSFSGGLNCIASGSGSVSIGKTNRSSGSGSVTFGELNDATGNFSFASGTMSDATGLRAIAMGYDCEATGTSATAIGSSNIARGEYSFATGVLTTARAYASMTVGRYNDTTASSQLSWTLTDPLFVIGNGFSNTSRSNALTVLKNGNVGIGIVNPGFLLNFPSDLGDKISLSGNSGNHFGFGVQTSLLQIHTDNNSADIAFGYGSSAAFTERMRIKGNGNVGIGTTTPGFPLNFSNSLGDKISLWGNSGTHYGFGIQSNALQIHADVQSSDVVFGYGTSAALTETMRIKGNGNVGIGINNPTYKLDIFGRMRLRHGADGSPGIWFNKSDNTVPIAFMGLLNNEYIGLYGEQGSAWNFLMSTITGNVGIGLQAPTQKLHVNGGGLFNGIFRVSPGASGATANANAVGIFENNNTAYINLLTPNANESGVLFGNVVSAANGGIIYNSASTLNGLQFRTNGNVTRMSLSGTGFLGVGTTNPITQLHVRDGNSGANPPTTSMATFEDNGDVYITLSAPDAEISGIRFNHPENTGTIRYTPEDGFWFTNPSYPTFVIDVTGNVGINNPDPDEDLDVFGNGKFGGVVFAACGVLSCSDIRYKKNISPLTNVLSEIQVLNGTYYYWDKENHPDKNFSDHRQIGILAQELEKVYPELVHTDKEGYKTVDYSRLSPILLEAIKEQQQMIELQNTKLETQQEQIDFLMKEMEVLKKKNNSLVNVDQSSIR